MAKLFYRFGAMNSGKTANALMFKYNLKERGLKVLYCKPVVDTRDGEGLIKSRCGLQSECINFEDLDVIDFKEYDYIIVDEVHFLDAYQIGKLAHIVDYENIDVFCYGLKNDFRGRLFEGIKELLVLADKIEELHTTCWCGKKATQNARIFDGKVVREGSQVQIGGNESYMALCRKHMKEGKLHD